MSQPQEIIPEFTYKAISEIVEKLGHTEKVTHDWIRSLHPLARLRLLCLHKFGTAQVAEEMIQFIVSAGFVVGGPKFPEPEKPLIITP